MKQLFKTQTTLGMTMTKTMLFLLIISSLPQTLLSQNAKAPRESKELTVYTRVKDHITHLDIDSSQPPLCQ